MTSAHFRSSLLCFALAAPFLVQTAVGQQPTPVAPPSGAEPPHTTVPAPKTQPDQSVPQQMPPDTHAPAKQQVTPPADTSKDKTSANVPNRADAYYHYALAHMYEELVALYQRSEFATKAIDEYKAALQADPNSDYLNAGLAALYFHTNRIADAIQEAQAVIQRNPDNVEARKLLGGIYLQSLGDAPAGAQTEQMLKRAIEQYQAIVRIKPDDYESRVLLGRLFMMNKSYSESEEQFKAVLAKRPANEEALSYLAYVYNEEGDAKKAAQLLEGIPEAQRTARLNSALGFSYEQQHQYKQAIDAYKRAAEADPENLDTQRSLAQTLYSDGQYEAALKQNKKVADADPQDAQTLLRMAEIQRHLGQFDAAYGNLKKAQTLIPDSQEVQYNEAVILEGQGRFDEAAKALEALVQKTTRPNMSAGEKNNEAIFLERLGNLYKEQNKTQAAVDTYRKMIALGKEQAERGWGDIIDAYREARMYPQATAAAQEAVKAMPDDRPLRLTLASHLADTGKVEDGLKIAQSLLGKGDDREVLIALSQMYSRLRRFPQAEETLKKADDLSTKQDEKDYINFLYGALYEREKKYEPAELYFRKVLARDPNNGMTLNYLGYMFAENGSRLDEAQALVKKAVDQDPQNGAYLDSLGWVYYKQGKLDLAEQTLRRAAERIQTDGTVHSHLGEVFAKQGKLKLAAAQWERAMDEYGRSLPSDNDPTEVADTQKKLESARVKLAKQNQSALKEQQ